VKALQRRTGIALWRQVADQIRQTVLTGLAANERLPAEAELATRFGVNRHTVRSAIAALEKEGILRAEQGRGTFLNDRKRLRYPIGRRTRFSSGLEDQAQTRSGKLLSSETLPAPLHVATALSLPAAAPVIQLSTLSAADGVPVSAATSWFDASRFPKSLVSMQRPARSPPRWRASGSTTTPARPPPWKPGMPAARISICSLSRPAPSCS
jgi:GntR family phosphonate transport system transcriptional regulator